jgi:predicted Rossmann fold nucleotide-binding protein DprA/Smf involved in DNA uptake
MEPAVANRPHVSEPALALLTLLADGARDADELVRATGRPSPEVAAALIELELAGLVAAAAGVYRAFNPGRSPALLAPA